ncbi:BON domain-containing protein [uncultured Agrobacterium sp.]|uniref:BON domain-containing protein n=1 Tax=uncultured Agrobacterium sp. TaxID=157277 RepID=UPI002583BBFF|nr:BON domain-containing protein [uncultured Agrobacterium sp.]
MFLSTLHDSNAFAFCMGGTLAARKAAVEAELRHLPNFSGTDVNVDVDGGCVVITGSVANQLDLYRALDIATDIVGAAKIIFRVTYAPVIA